MARNHRAIERNSGDLLLGPDGPEGGNLRVQDLCFSDLDRPVRYFQHCAGGRVEEVEGTLKGFTRDGRVFVAVKETDRHGNKVEHVQDLEDSNVAFADAEQTLAAR